jgi:hypothetical protein
MKPDCRDRRPQKKTIIAWGGIDLAVEEIGGIMKFALVMMISMAGFAFAADPKPNTSTEPQSGDLRRLESVTWDLKTHTLSWVVQKGKEEHGEFVPTGSQRYQITPDDATMGVPPDKRAIEEDEAAVLHHLLDALSIYCAQSVVWWDQGEGTPAPSSPSLKPDPNAKPGPANQNDGEQKKPAPVKAVKALPLGVAEVAAHPPVH